MKISAYCLLLVASIAMSCEQESAKKTGEELTEPVCGIRVKAVFSFCSFIFLEIQDEEYYHLGDADFRLVGGRETKPVFRVTNVCDFGAELHQNNLLDTTFEVKLVTTYNNDCAVCMGGYGGPLPAKSQIVRVCTAVEE